MKYLLRMAFRNLGRNRVRSAVSVVAITISVAVVIFAKGFIGGMVDSFLDNTIRLTSGHVRVVQAEYPKKERLLTLTNPVDGRNGEGADIFAERLSKLPGVAVATPRIKFGALVTRGEKPESVLGLGMDFGREEQAAHLSRYLTKGRFPKPGADEILVGQRLLDKFGLKVGSRLTVVANTSYGSMNGRTFTVVGSLVSGLAQLDESSVFLSFRSAQDFVELPQAATEIILMAKDQNKVPQLNAEVAQVVKDGDPVGNYKVIPWYEANTLVSFMSVAKNIYGVFYILIVLFASFVVINTMLMIVNERTQEIGMLGAMGFTGRQIVLLLVLEGAALGLVGSTAGVALGTFITKGLAATGIDYSQATQTIGKELLYPSKIYPVFSLGSALYAFFLGIVIPALGCYLPARRAQKLDPSTALRAL